MWCCSIFVGNSILLGGEDEVGSKSKLAISRSFALVLLQLCIPLLHSSSPSLPPFSTHSLERKGSTKSSASLVLVPMASARQIGERRRKVGGGGGRGGWGVVVVFVVAYLLCSSQAMPWSTFV